MRRSLIDRCLEVGGVEGAVIMSICEGIAWMIALVGVVRLRREVEGHLSQVLDGMGKGEGRRHLKPPLKTCTSIHYQNHERMRPKTNQISQNKITRIKHTNHTTAPSYHNTHKNSLSLAPYTSNTPPKLHFNTLSKSRVHSTNANQISQK